MANFIIKSESKLIFNKLILTKIYLNNQTEKCLLQINQILTRKTF